VFPLEARHTESIKYGLNWNN